MQAILHTAEKILKHRSIRKKLQVSAAALWDERVVVVGLPAEPAAADPEARDGRHCADDERPGSNIVP